MTTLAGADVPGERRPLDLRRWTAGGVATAAPRRAEKSRGAASWRELCSVRWTSGLRRDQQLPEEFGQRLVRPGDVLAAVDQGRHLRGAVPAPVVRDEGVGGEHRFQLLRRVAALLA
jgi:hypothetical protein